MTVKMNVIDNKGVAANAKEYDLDFLLQTDGSDKCVTDAVKQFLATRRSGSANTKLMSEISGSNHKPFRQKGTGRARQGNARAVQMRGGRTCFGPQPRDFSFALPKKVVRKALKLTLKDKLAEEQVVLLSGMADMETIKTKQAKAIIDSLQAKKVLVVYKDEMDDYNFLMSIRNLPNVYALRFDVLNTYSILNAEKILLDENCVINLIEVLQK